MKPAPFIYFDPETLDEALALLAEHGDEAKILAGGQTLGPLLNMRLAAPAVIVDVNRIRELDYRRGEGGGLDIGALTRQSALEDDASLRERQPLVTDALPHVAHRAIRNRGTVAGSLAHADPAAEWPGLVTALGGELVLKRAADGTRTVGADDFFIGPLTTALEPEEMLVEIRLPPWPAGSGWSFMEFSRRHGDFALVGVLVRVGLDADGHCEDPRIALIGIGSGPVRARRAEELLAGETPDKHRLDEVVRQAASGLEPDDDLHASADFRRHLAAVLTRRTLTQALERARGG